jgi:hypothetical protein
VKKFLIPLLATLIVLGILVIVVGIVTEETFTITEKDTDTFIWIESNKRLNPTYKRASLNIKNTRIMNANGEEIDYQALAVGDKIKVDFKPITLFSDPPIVGAWEVTRLNK